VPGELEEDENVITATITTNHGDTQDAETTQRT
jgi:hypothetical protein